jgi:hypothetical protein
MSDAPASSDAERPDADDSARVPPPPPDDAERLSGGGTRRAWRRYVALALLLVFFAFVMQRVLFPHGDEPYVEVPHGDHVHYVPRDRDPDVPVGEFPTQPPGPNERITPDGRVVPATSGDDGGSGE